MKKEIDEISEEIRLCTKCRLWEKRTIAVPGEGPAKATIMFVGEAPGQKEDLTGRPFVGRSGVFLNSLLELSDLKRKDVFITSVIKCRPPNNRTPLPDEMKTCINAWLWKQIELIDPTLIVILGNVALKGLLNKEQLKNNHGKTVTQNERKFFVTYHPAAGIRFPKIKRMLEEDFKKLKNEIAGYDGLLS